MAHYTSLAIKNSDELIFGKAPHPLKTRRGLVIGGGIVYPELNFTLPTIEICDAQFDTIKEMYSSIIDEACRRAVDLEFPGFVVEFETLIEMTLNPHYAIELTKVIVEKLDYYYNTYQLPTALRVTPNDTREKVRPPMMRSGALIDQMLYTFEECAKAGADLLSIESTGGKEIHDDAIVTCDIEKSLFGLSIMGVRDMDFLWGKIVEIAKRTGTIAAGDSACGFGNTAMVLAEKRFVPRIFAAIVRVMTINRSLVAHEKGAVGPGKDCAYENPFLKAITGYPMSMEGKTAACAHLSPVGNIASATCDLWSNESVQNIKLLGGMAPTISMEQLIYDCRLMNQATKEGGALTLRNWLVNSDMSIDPQAFVLAPENVIKISQAIVDQPNHYMGTKAAALKALELINEGVDSGKLKLPDVEVPWLSLIGETLKALPNDEGQFIERVLPTLEDSKFRKEEYLL